jgi:hypothetical protein
LRAEDFLSGPGEAALAGNFEECDELIEIHAVWLGADYSELRAGTVSASAGPVGGPVHCMTGLSELRCLSRP